MSTTVFQEGFHRGEFLVSEARGNRSRDVGTIAATSISYQSGTIVSFVVATGKYTAYDETSQTANTAAAVLYDHADPRGGDVHATLITRDAEINAQQITGLPTITPQGLATALTQLATRGIIARGA